MNNSQIYSYNFKSKTTENKNHIFYGFVIGENYLVPKEVLNEDEKAIDLYSMAALNWRAT
jgi:hypothetical protein